MVDMDFSEIDPAVMFKAEQGKKAMDEKLHNMFVRGRKDCGNTLSENTLSENTLPENTDKCYEAFLRRDYYGDWSNEFESVGVDHRDNKHHHNRWENTTKESEYKHVYTNDDDNFTKKTCVNADPPVRCEDGTKWSPETRGRLPTPGPRPRG
jgi:hypothetical protein